MEVFPVGHFLLPGSDVTPEIISSLFNFPRSHDEVFSYGLEAFYELSCTFACSGNLTGTSGFQLSLPLQGGARSEGSSTCPPGREPFPSSVRHRSLLVQFFSETLCCVQN